MTRETVAYHEAAHAVVAEALGRSVAVATIEPDEWSLGFVEHRLNVGVFDYEGASSLPEAIRLFATAMIIDMAVSNADNEPGEPDSEFRVALKAMRAFNSLDAHLADRKLTEGIYESSILILMAGQAAECALRQSGEPDWTGGSSSDKAAIDRAILDLASTDTARTSIGGTDLTPYGTQAYVEYLWCRAILMVANDWTAVEAVAAELLKLETLDGDRVREVIARVQPEPPPLSDEMRSALDSLGLAG